MMRFTLLLFMALLSGANRLAAQEKVEVRGVTSEVKIEEVTFGHLSELNGKFKLRASELTFAPGAFIGAHHHIGPGIRYIISGELTFIEGGQSTVYKAGEYYYETGNIAHSAENKTNLPLRILVMEIIPKNWSGPAMIRLDQSDRQDVCDGTSAVGESRRRMRRVRGVSPLPNRAFDKFRPRQRGFRSDDSAPTRWLRGARRGAAALSRASSAGHAATKPPPAKNQILVKPLPEMPRIFSFRLQCANDEIAYFQEQRRPDRFFPGTTTPKPLHPIIIEGVPSMVQAGGHYESRIPRITD